VVNDLETGLVQILTEPWIPQARFEIEASIASVRRNMQWVEDHIADRVDQVIERGHADEMFRLSTARILHDLLRLQLDWLLTAWTKTMGHCPCGCGRVEPQQGWTN
jgi:tRNA A37 N6-isopentenylltransferase MiaA